MIKKNLLNILIVIFFMNAEAQGKSWQEVARNDLEYIYTSIKDNHPGYLDEENPNFRVWLEDGYEGGLKNIADADDAIKAMSAINRYIAGFADVHLRVGFYPQTKYIQWAGLLMNKPGNLYQVLYADNKHFYGLPPEGSILLACNQIPVDEIMAKEILKYRFDAPDLEDHRVRSHI